MDCVYVVLSCVAGCVTAYGLIELGYYIAKKIRRHRMRSTKSISKTVRKIQKALDKKEKEKENV